MDKMYQYDGQTCNMKCTCIYMHFNYNDINNSYYTYKIPLSLGLVVKSGVKRPLSCSQCKFH